MEETPSNYQEALALFDMSQNLRQLDCSKLSTETTLALAAAQLSARLELSNAAAATENDPARTATGEEFVRRATFDGKTSLKNAPILSVVTEHSAMGQTPFSPGTLSSSNKTVKENSLIARRMSAGRLITAVTPLSPLAPSQPVAIRPEPFKLLPAPSYYAPQFVGPMSAPLQSMHAPLPSPAFHRAIQTTPVHSAHPFGHFSPKSAHPLSSHTDSVLFSPYPSFSSRASPLSAGPQSAKPKKMCSHCGTTDTPSWRRCPKGQRLLCNACGLYEKLHRAPRPFKTENGQVKAQRTSAVEQSKCFHCGTQDTPLWRRSVNGSILCNACGLYEKQHQDSRPLAGMKAPKQNMNLKWRDSMSVPSSPIYGLRQPLVTPMPPTFHFKLNSNSPQSTPSSPQINLPSVNSLLRISSPILTVPTVNGSQLPPFKSHHPVLSTNMFNFIQRGNVLTPNSSMGASER